MITYGSDLPKKSLSFRSLPLRPRQIVLIFLQLKTHHNSLGCVQSAVHEAGYQVSIIKKLGFITDLIDKHIWLLMSIGIFSTMKVLLICHHIIWYFKSRKYMGLYNMWISPYFQNGISQRKLQIWFCKIIWEGKVIILLVY